MKKSQDSLLKYILEADREGANGILVNWAKKNGEDKALTQLLEPTLEKIGQIWENSQNVSLAQAYVAGKISEDFMLKVADKTGNKNILTINKDKVILGNIEDDYHSLGRKMVSIFLRSNGWNVIDLGNDVIASDFVNKALDENAKFIGVSAMMYSTALNIRKVRDEIDKRNLTGQIKLVVGGAVFKLRSDLVNEVGGDATAGNAIQAPAVFDNLLQNFKGII